MKRIYDLYRDATQLLGQHRVYLKPGLFCDALYFASRGLFDQYYGKTETYRPGHPVPPVAYQVTTAVTSALSPFLREAIFGKDEVLIAAKEVEVGPSGRMAGYYRLDDAGRCELPEGWVHPTAWDTDDAEQPVRTLDDNEVRATLSSRICAPDLANPMLTGIPGGVQVYPAEVRELRAKYLGMPVRPEYVVDYPDGDDGPPVYNNEKSVDVEWRPAQDNQLLMRLLQYPALGLRDQVVQQVAQELTQRGT